MQALTPPIPHFLRALACSALFAALAPPASAAISCSSISNVINLGSNINVLLGAPAAITGTINISCTRTFPVAGPKVRVCLHFGRGTASAIFYPSNAAAYNPRLLINGGSSASPAAGFVLNHNGAATNITGIAFGTATGSSGYWGSSLDAQSPPAPFESTTATDYSATSFTINLPYSVQLTDIAGLGVNGTTTVSTITPGTYSTSLSSPTHAALSIAQAPDGTIINSDCSVTGINYGNSNIPMTFTVSATVSPQCIITNDGSIAALDFGSASTHAAPSVPNPSTTLSVQCTRTTPYAIGLLPSNGNANGAGIMSAGGSPDTVPYQLRKGPGASAAVWGNTTAPAPGLAGNGVQGTGTGVAVNHIVYGTVAGTNYRGGNYTDTVTVTVNY